jgi:hypothetical protein
MNNRVARGRGGGGVVGERRDRARRRVGRGVKRGRMGRPGLAALLRTYGFCPFDLLFSFCRKWVSCSLCSEL